MQLRRQHPSKHRGLAVHNNLAGSIVQSRVRLSVVIVRLRASWFPHPESDETGHSQDPDTHTAVQHHQTEAVHERGMSGCF